MGTYSTGFFHHIGTFFLLVATVLLIVTTISAPVVDDISLLKVHLSGTNGNTISFGTFGWCLTQDGPNDCSKSRVGYSPTSIVNMYDDVSYSHSAVSSTNTLTKVMILHPIATAILFIAFLMSLGAGIFGSLLAAVIAMLGFVTTIIALICDFVLFHVVKDNIDDQRTGANGGDDTYARYGVAIWCLLASAVCSLLGTIVVFLTCCSGRLHRRRQARSKVDHYSPPATTTRRRRWWSRRAY